MLGRFLAGSAKANVSILQPQSMGFKSRFKRTGVPVKHKKTLQVHGERKIMNIPQGLGGKQSLIDGPMKIGIKVQNVPLYGLKFQPTPIKDNLNFKAMACGNEVLLNLENYENFETSELIGGLLELARRDAKQDHDWTTHPITEKCLRQLKRDQPQLNPKHCVQSQIILDRFKVTDASFWQLNSVHVLRQLHKFKARDFAQFLDVYDRDVEDEMGEPLGVKKCDPLFFERIIGLYPMFVKEMNNSQIVRSLEVMVNRNIGSDRLFEHYILFMIEKHVLKYSVNLYSRMVRVMAEKGFSQDYVFWDKFAFQYVFYDPRQGGERQFSHDEAKELWDSFVFLKIKCPTLDIKEVLQQLEKFIEVEPLKVTA